MEVYLKSTRDQLLCPMKPSVLLDKIEFKLNDSENNLNDHKLLKQQYHFLKPNQQKQQQIDRGNGMHANAPNKLTNRINGKNDGIPSPKHILCSPTAIQLEWKQTHKIGAGCSNLGNTCFMNSVLQALTYCPPLVNYLLVANSDHQEKCKVVALCMTCELTKHMKNAFANSSGTIRPQNIFNRLKSLSKSFQPGRQEDSHEFLRYVIDNIWKSCIINWEQIHGTKLDSQSKETTFINQIFGGYHRSQITCLNCKAKSDTYDYFMDFILDIKSVSSLERALGQFVQPEILRNENAYKCSNCSKKVSAEKRFTVHRAPNVATFQLKRFDYNRIFGGKITKSISYPEVLNLRPFMSENQGEPINYKLFGVLVHMGGTSNSGHYFCYVRNSNNSWYLMDDSRVSSSSLSQVLDQQAYILFYVRLPKKSVSQNTSISSDKPHSINSSLTNRVITNHNSIRQNGHLHKESNDTPVKSNLPRVVDENSNNHKLKHQSNGESSNTNKQNESPSTKNLPTSILNEIDKRITINLNGKTQSSHTSLLKPVHQSSSTVSTEATNSNGLNGVHPKTEQDETRSTSIKRLVPYDKNSSSSDEDDSKSLKNGLSLLSKTHESSNGTKKFKIQNNSSESVEKCSNMKKATSHVIATSNTEISNAKELKTPKLRPEDDECQNKELMQSVTNHLAGNIQANSEKEKRQLLNGFAKFAESLGSLLGSETDDLKQTFESMSKEKIEFANEKKQQTIKTPQKSLQSSTSSSSEKLAKANTPQKKASHHNTPMKNLSKSSDESSQSVDCSNKSQFDLTKSVSSPAKINGYLSNNYYQSKQANLLSHHWTSEYSMSKADKKSSIASGSSTNSINSTTEWQVIERDTVRLKKRLHRQTDNSWQVADVNRKSRSPSESAKDTHDCQRFFDGMKSSRQEDENYDSEDNFEDTNRTKQSSKFDGNSFEIQKLIEKKLRKIGQKNKKKLQELYQNPDALRNFYLKINRKYSKKFCKSDQDVRRHKKKHKKHSRRAESPLTKDHCREDQDLFSSSREDVFNAANFKKLTTPPKNGIHQTEVKRFNQIFASDSKKDIKSELNDMHLSLLGKNVNTWNGKKTQVDREVIDDLERNNKKSKDDLYNEDYDKGKIKKLKSKSHDEHNRNMPKQNPFQKFYNEQYCEIASNKNRP